MKASADTTSRGVRLATKRSLGATRNFDEMQTFLSTCTKWCRRSTGRRVAHLFGLPHTWAASLFERGPTTKTRKRSTRVDYLPTHGLRAKATVTYRVPRTTTTAAWSTMPFSRSGMATMMKELARCECLWTSSSKMARHTVPSRLERHARLGAAAGAVPALPTRCCPREQARQRVGTDAHRGGRGDGGSSFGSAGQTSSPPRARRPTAGDARWCRPFAECAKTTAHRSSLPTLRPPPTAARTSAA